MRLGDDDYKKTKVTQQDIISVSPELLKKKLKNYVQIHPDNYEDIDMGVMISYITKDNKYRSGGTLLENGAPDYYVLKNPFKGISWSVQLKDVHIFLKDKEDKRYEMIERNNLYRLYKAGYVKILDEPDPEFLENLEN